MADPRRFCERCRGLGFDWRIRGGVPEIVPCPACHGKGSYINRPFSAQDHQQPRLKQQEDNWAAEDTF